MKLVAVGTAAVALIVTLMVAPAYAMLQPDPVSRSLTAYLHGHRLPLVQAQVFTDIYGFRTLVLYGFVATPLGKVNAEKQARRFLKVSGLVVHNRIKVRPQLLASPGPANVTEPVPASGAAPPSQAAARGNDFNEAQEAGPAVGNIRQYQEQQENDQTVLPSIIIVGPTVIPLMPVLPPGPFPPPVFVPPMAPYVIPAPRPFPYYRTRMIGPAMPFPVPPAVVTTRPITVPAPAFTSRPLPLPGQLPPGYAPGPVYGPAPVPFGMPRPPSMGFGMRR